ncbi:hypothetical protein HPP92_010454 [Vanilla planifolia]|uniref:Uncharacterized protein n=1 Tax=Vanilla planifolia TaxID=51239 RepID=A0A835R6I0_VANPL|nr:hypothetical protein HPP92_010706 [Vanilla planifolia]KAG0482370.1 hypothetical protein HPP92_010454 [Vanilla planifolia]
MACRAVFEENAERVTRGEWDGLISCPGQKEGEDSGWAFQRVIENIKGKGEAAGR